MNTGFQGCFGRLGAVGVRKRVKNDAFVGADVPSNGFSRRSKVSLFNASIKSSAGRMSCLAFLRGYNHANHGGLSMPQLSENYPDGLTTKELRSAIKAYANEISTKRGDINTVLQFSPLIQIGTSEIQARRTVWATKVSLLIALLALGIAIIGVRSGSEWEGNQLQLLEAMDQNVKVTAGEIDRLNQTGDQLLQEIRSVIPQLLSEDEVTAERKEE